MKKIQKRKGLSPVVATVLLIAIVVVIALIIFLWFRNIMGERVTKFKEENIELTCGRVKFSASYDSGVLTITNTGDIPIYRIKVKEYTGGSHDTTELGWTNDPSVSSGLNQGGVWSNSSSLGGDKIILLPVLSGKNEDGESRYYFCEDESNGVEV